MLPTSQTPPLPSQRTLIPINIETLAGTSFELLVSPYEQIQSIKRKIERREGIPIPHQHLIWKSNELEDESCLNDHSIEAGTTIKLVLAMRGGPVNTKRVPIEDSFIRDMSEYIENSQDDYGTDLLPSSNKNVTFLVLRDGDQFNFFQVIDRGDGTLSPLSGSVSAASMYNTHETIAVETDRQYDEKRQADDRKTKQKMELIRSKLKTHPRKDILLPPRPPSSSKKSKSNLIHPHHPRRSIHVDTNSNLSVNGDNSSGTSSLEQQQLQLQLQLQQQQQQQQQQRRPLSYSFPANFFNTYNLLSSTTADLNRNDLLHEEDSEDDDDSHDDDDEQKPQIQQQIFTSRSFSPSIFYTKKRNNHQHSTTKKLLSQETATTTTTTTSANDASSNAVLVDYIHRRSPALPMVSTSSRILSATKYVNTSEQPSINSNDKMHSTNEILYHHSRASPMLELNDDEIISPTTITRKQTADIQSRNETSLSKPLWTDDDEQINVSDEYTTGERTSTSQSILFRHQNSSTSTTAHTPMPTLPLANKKSSLPSTTQKFFHHHQPISNEQQQQQLNKPSPRSLVPLSLSKHRHKTSNTNLTTSTQQQIFVNSSNNSSNDLINNGNTISTINNTNGTDSFNEHLMLNKRIEILKTPGKQQSPQSTAPSPSSSSNTIYPPPPPPSNTSKRNVPQKEIKSVPTTTTVPPSSSSLIPIDSTKVTIETIGPKTVSALLRQNATIEPVDTSRGVGKHLVSLLTTASKETTSIKTGYKQSSRDAIIEERYKLDSKLSNPWSNTINNNLQSNTTTSYNSNKLPPVIINRKSTSKCFLCKKKTGLATTYQCRCGSSFCSEHRYPEAHACAFDYKAEGKRLIERNNPLITAPKLPKI
ncbi:unnamed protein product [Rotaria magnacalcarata]